MNAAPAEHTAADLIRRLARPEIAALQAYASARALAADQGVLLNANENPWPPPQDNGLHLNRYPEPQPAALRQRLAALYGVAPEQLLLTRGSDEGIDLLVRAFCRAGTDAIAICPPCFGMYEIAARIQGADVLTYPLMAERGFAPDFAALAATRAKLIFLCTPNNPTGNLLPAEAVLELAAQMAGRALVVVDEAYIEFAAVPSLCGRLADASNPLPNLLVLRTLSKAWGLAGARLGALVGDAHIIRLLRNIIAPYPLPKPTVALALAALEQPARMHEQVRQLSAERERVAARLRTLAATGNNTLRDVFSSAANFLLARVTNAAALVDAAARAGILLRDQSRQPGLDNCVRISIGSREENQVLLTFLENLPREHGR